MKGIALTKKQFVMLVGVPASGKTTYRKDYCRDYAVISSDDYIEERAKEDNTTYNEAFTKYVGAATKSCQAKFILATSAGFNIIWDQTNLSSDKRRRVLEQLPSDYIKTCVVFPCPEYDEHQKRLASREGKVIPPHIINTMRKNFELPDVSEGFDYIIEMVKS